LLLDSQKLLYCVAYDDNQSIFVPTEVFVALPNTLSQIFDSKIDSEQNMVIQDFFQYQIHSKRSSKNALYAYFQILIEFSNFFYFFLFHLL